MTSTESVVSEMADTVLEPVFVTNTSFFPESYAAPNGALPTFIVATTVLLESDITDTLFEPSFVTNTSPRLGS